MSVSDFTLFGRLHPLVLHAPIGFLLAALVLEAMATRAKLARPALGLFLWLAAFAAVFTAASGCVLSHEDGYGGATLERHEQLGIALALVAVLAAILHGARGRLGLWPYRGALLLACGLLFPAGHLGSELTHGSDWLAGPREAADAPAAEQANPAVLAPPEDSTGTEGPDVYAEVIAPMLAARCSACHGPKKHKGGLRLDSYAALLTGGDGGPVLVPGDPGASPMFQRASLPLEHEDHMPPEGKPQPTPEELAALAAWIAAGATESAGVARPDESLRPAAAPAPEPVLAPAAPLEAPAEALAALARALVHHERVDPTRPELWIDVAAVAPTFGDGEVRALLVPLAPWIAELALARSALTDAALAELARFPRLTRLDLRATGVGAAGLAALAGASTLVELNLAETRVGDSSIEALLGFPDLRTVSLWSSGFTPDGLTRLRAARPELRVEAGDEPPAAALEVEGELVYTSDRAVPGAELVPEGLRPINAICPVSGSPVNPAYALVHTNAEGTRVLGFCCPKCPQEFWADPARFEAALR